MGKLIKMQPTLIHEPITKDVVMTPGWLARAIINHFRPMGVCLDPCVGDGAFFNLLPSPKYGCEIEQGVDFYAWSKPVDWIISNPPYSNLLSWIRHSFGIAKNIVYLIPLHRVFSSAPFINDMMDYGGIVEILLCGTGATAGFPFGHALGAVYWKQKYKGQTQWRILDEQQ